MKGDVNNWYLFPCLMKSSLSRLWPSPWWRRHPASVFPDCQKTTALRAAVFGTPYHASFPHMLWKIHTQVTQGHVTRSRQVTSPYKSLNVRQSYTRPNDCLETFSDCYKQQCLYLQWISHSFDIGDLRSGQFFDLSIWSQWEKIEKCLFWTKRILNTQTSGYRYNSHSESKNCYQWPLLMTPR